MQTQKIEQATNELLKLILSSEGIDIDTFSDTGTGMKSVTTALSSRRGSIPRLELDLPPGEQAAMRKRQRQEELRDEAQDLMEHFTRRNLDALIYTTRSALEKLRRALTPPSTINYSGEQQDKDDRVPVLKLELALSIPNLTIRPNLDDVQSIVNQVVQTILAVHKRVYQWGQSHEDLTSQSLEQASLLSPSHANAATTSQSNALKMPSQVHIPERKTFFRMVSENKEIAKILTTLSSVITSAKTVVVDSYSHFNAYQMLWQTDQNNKVAEFTEQDPSLGDFEGELRHYEQLEADVMAEEDQILIGAFILDTCKFSQYLKNILILILHSKVKIVYSC